MIKISGWVVSCIFSQWKINKYFASFPFSSFNHLLLKLVDTTWRATSLSSTSKWITLLVHKLLHGEELLQWENFSSNDLKNTSFVIIFSKLFNPSLNLARLVVFYRAVLIYFSYMSYSVTFQWGMWTCCHTDVNISFPSLPAIVRNI